MPSLCAGPPCPPPPTPTVRPPQDSSGRISVRNMRRIAKELGENLTDDELQAMIDEFDEDRDGEISFDEFSAIMKSTSLYE